jgi:hypothetical protein
MNYATHRYQSKVRDAVKELKRGPCSDCGQCFDPVCMDFDHRPGESKLKSVAQCQKHGMKVVLAEIDKCDLVCSNCHRLRTETRRLYAVEVRRQS